MLAADFYPNQLNWVGWSLVALAMIGGLALLWDAGVRGRRAWRSWHKGKRVRAERKARFERIMLKTREQDGRWQ